MAKYTVVKPKDMYWKSIKLWQHQKEAISKALNYYTNFSKHSITNAHKAYLIKMPTGSGKTGIMAVLSRCFSSIKNVIILVPSEALRDQLIRHISKEFWEKLNVNQDNIINKKCIKLLPSTIENELDDVEEKPFIAIGTIQALQEIYKEKQDKYDRLKSLISLAFFDEGHREPAVEWAKAVRGLRKPLVLFTATPYRNDLKMFNIDTDDYYFLSHSAAVAGFFIREIEIEEEYELSKGFDHFVDKLIKYVEAKKDYFKSVGIQTPKVIVRCSQKEEVRIITNKLRKAGKKAIGIHEEFNLKKKDIHLVKNVPDSKVSPYEYYIHQFKLVEGIDDPDFCVLAVYKSFSNARSVIQQIGRIIRNTSCQLTQKAFVLGDSKFKLNLEWRNYNEYDKYCENKGRFLNLGEVLKEYVRNHPDTYYFDGGFKSKLNFDKQHLYKSLNFRLTANVFEPLRKESLAQVEEGILTEWGKYDYDIQKIARPDQNTIIIIYIKYQNSSLLTEDLFIEFTLCYTYLKLTDHFLFYHDTHGNKSEYINEHFIRAPHSKLMNLFEHADKYQQISLINCDLGRHCIRSNSISAYSMENIAPTLSDHTYFCSTANVTLRTHKNQMSNRRYLGLTRSKITDQTSRVSFEEYEKWIGILDKKIRSSNILYDGVLNRYAEYVGVPTNTDPINILLDINDIIDNISCIEDKSQEILIDDLCCNVKDNKFKLNISNIQYDVDIKFDGKKKRYILSSQDLETKYGWFPPGLNKPESIIGYLNRTQNFRLITKTKNVVYAFSNFYSPRFNLIGRSSKNRLELLRIFEPFNEVNEKQFEKGSKDYKVTHSLWHKKTLFGLVASQANGCSEKLKSHFGFDILVCNDLGMEESDFIGINITQKRVVLIHIKASQKRTNVSATAFQVVCGQLIKNLNFLIPYSEKDFTYKKWNGNWDIDDYGGSVPRIICGGKTGKEINDLIKEILYDTNSIKEAWIVIGNGFDYEDFKDKLNHGKCNSEHIQLVYLLMSTWNAASQVGVKLKVFC